MILIRKFFVTTLSAAVFVGLAVAANAQETTANDPTGFVGLLNNARAARGLRLVVHDPGAVAVAAQNNSLQLAYGLGHWATGGLGQVAAVGAGDARSALAMWISSPPHYALLFAPDLASVGFDIRGNAATASTRQGGYGYAAPATTWGMAAPAWSYGPPAYYGRGWRWRRGW